MAVWERASSVNLQSDSPHGLVYDREPDNQPHRGRLLNVQIVLQPQLPQRHLRLVDPLLRNAFLLVDLELD